MPTTITKPQQKLSESPKTKILAPYVQMRLNKIFYDELNSHDSIFVKFD